MRAVEQVVGRVYFYLSRQVEIVVAAYTSSSGAEQIDNRLQKASVRQGLFEHLRHR